MPRVHTPAQPLGYGSEYPDHFYTDCTTPIESGIPDFQGDWVESSVTIGGITIDPPVNGNVYSERIEQCGNRLLIASQGVLNEIFLNEEDLFFGLNDYSAQGNEIHATGRVEGNEFRISPVLPANFTGGPIPDITRELLTDDYGSQVLRFVNILNDRIIYMKKVN